MIRKSGFQTAMKTEIQSPLSFAGLFDPSDYKGNWSSPEEETEKTRQDRRDRQEAQDHIEVARHNSSPGLPPGAPFKCQTKEIVKGCQNLALIVIPKHPAKTPGMDAIILSTLKVVGSRREESNTPSTDYDSVALTLSYTGDLRSKVRLVEILL